MNKLNQLPYMFLFTTYIVHIEEFPAVLFHEGNEHVKQLFYTIVCSLIMDHKARNMRELVFYNISVSLIKSCA